MANYTKIGRIRPDYADTWDATRSFTALEMVKSADSYHAYIAKQDVPAETPLTNAEYWGEVLDVSDVIAESVAATNRANTAAANADAAREGIQDDLNGLHDELRTKADGILCTAEGETISLTDASDDPMRGLVLFGKTTYDGTPSPENPVTLVNKGEKGSTEVTAAGKNLAENVTIISDGLFIKADAKLVKGVTYTLSVNAPADALYFSDGAGSSDYAAAYYVKSLTYTAEFTGACTLFVRYGTGADLSYNMQLEIGETATDYESYRGTQEMVVSTPDGLPGVPAAVDGNYTDVDGRLWVGDEKDLGKGVHVHRIGCLDMGTLSWVKFGANNVYYTEVADGRHYGTSVIGGAICECYSNIDNAVGNDKTFTFGSNFIGGKACSLVVHDDGLTDLDAFLSAVSGKMLYYELATPVETPLTAEEIAAFRALHTNKPTTTITNDEGAHMAVSYNADTKTYIDNKISELAAAIVNTNA